MERTITVTGTGRLSLPPDTIQIHMTLTAKNPDYAAVMQDADRRFAALQSAVEEAEIPAEKLRTEHYQVDTEYQHLPDENGNYRQVFAGYICRHTLMLELELDLKLLGEVLAAAEKSGAEPEFGITFTLRDQETVHEKLLKLAAEQAHKDAIVLATSAGAALGSLAAVRYHDEQPQAGGGMMLRAAKMCDAASITPEQITMEESAVFVWELN
ncbi:MAG: SIMPL domain-containing protein [Oscillospiraceae bacterium]|nr:SIMPL domain-containing protein [Oscillospiraceae bacterium]